MITKNHALLEIEVKAHVDADAVVAGHYWNKEDHTGCFIGCLAHSNDPKLLGDKYGLPLALVKIAENIFESLPAKRGKAFFSAMPAAVAHDGKNLSLVHWKFLASELRSMPAMPSNIRDVIDPVIAGLDLLASGVRPLTAYAASIVADAAYAAAKIDGAGFAAYAVAEAAYAATCDVEAADIATCDGNIIADITACAIARSVDAVARAYAAGRADHGRDDHARRIARARYNRRRQRQASLFLQLISDA